MKLRMRISTNGDDGWWDDAEISDDVFGDLINKSEIYSSIRAKYNIIVSYSNPISFISMYKDIESMEVVDIYMIIRSRND